jgi:phage I-like protein
MSSSKQVQIVARDDAAGAMLGIIAALGDGGVPAEIQVFPAGRIELADGDWFVADDAARESVISEFMARGIDMVFDYEHQTEGGEYSSPDGTAPAAGWVKRFINKGREGLWAAVEWTERARELLAKKEYRYYSPVFYVTKEGRRLFKVTRLALTNAPRLNWITPIVAKGRQAGRPAPQQQGQEGQGMEFLKLCAKLLGLPEDATQDQVVAALEAQLLQAAQPVIAKEVLTALELPDTAGESEVVASIHALKQTPDLTQEVAKLKHRLAERDRDDLVAAAIKQGKITVAQREWAEAYALRDPEGFRTFTAKAPQVVPVDQVTITDDHNPADPVIDETTLQIARIFGNTEEDLKKVLAA